ncbi:MAG: DUF4340 domain-containing protein [Burkholderiales bacterium]
MSIVRSRLLLNLALAVLVAALALFVWLQPGKPQAPTFPLFQQKAAAIRHIRIEKPGQPAIALEKERGRWRLTAPFAARADQLKIERLLNLLNVTASQHFSAADPQRFGLDKPLLRLAFNAETLAFGSLNPISNEQYVAATSGVYLIPPQAAADGYGKAIDFADKQLLASNEEPVGFTLPGLKLQRDGKGKWSGATDFSQDQLNAYADRWRNALASVVQPIVEPGKGEAASLLLASGKTIPLRILRQAPDLILARDDEGLQYHFPDAIGQRLLTPATTKP